MSEIPNDAPSSYKSLGINNNDSGYSLGGSQEYENENETSAIGSDTDIPRLGASMPPPLTSQLIGSSASTGQLLGSERGGASGNASGRMIHVRNNRNVNDSLTDTREEYARHLQQKHMQGSVEGDRSVTASYASLIGSGGVGPGNWTPRGAAIYIADKFQPGSSPGSVFTLLISTVGAGTLSLPFGIRAFGLVPGLILLAASAYMSYFCNDLLLISSNFLGTHHRPSYRALSLKAGGKKYGKCLATFAQSLLVIQLFGSLVSYIIAFSSLIDLVYSVYRRHGDPSSIYIEVACALTFGIVLPLGFFRNLTALRHTALLGFAFSTYLGIIVIVEYFRLCDTSDPWNGHGSTCFWQGNFKLEMDDLFPIKNGWRSFGSGLLTAWPLFCFGFTCQQSTLPVYVELQNRSRTRMRAVIGKALSMTLVLYIFVCICAYLTFIDGTCSNILLNDFHEHIEAILAALFIAISCTFTSIVFVNVGRLNISMLIYDSKANLALKPHIVITLVFVISSLLIALVVSDIGIVFGLLGSTTFPVVGYILPCVFFLLIAPKNRFERRKKVAIGMMTFIGVVSAISLGYKVFTYVSPTVSASASCKNQQDLPGTPL